MLFLAIAFSEEHPVVPTNGFEVFVFDPFTGMFLVSSYRPFPYCLKNGVVYGVESF